MKLSVIVPVFNEGKTVEKILQKLLNLKIAHEIVIVNDGSNDDTAEILNKIRVNYSSLVRVLKNKKNMGKGSSIRRALEVVSGDFIIIQDADLEYEPEDILRMIEFSNKHNAPVVFGSRFLSGKKISFHYLVNYSLTLFTNLLFKSHLTDMETCYKLCKLDLIRNLNLRSKRFEIEPEITTGLLKRKIDIMEIPISYRGRSYHRGKKITWVDGLRAVHTLLKSKFLSN